MSCGLSDDETDVESGLELEVAAFFASVRWVAGVGHRSELA